MVSGDTIRLASQYTKSVNGGKTYVTPTSRTFTAGQSVGFFIVANGWNGSGVNDRKKRYYSSSELNPEYMNKELEKLKAFHSVNVQSEVDENTVFMGWEDLPRDGSQWADHDFNDFIACLKVSPISAIRPQSYNSKSKITRSGTVISEDRRDYIRDSDYNDLNFEYDIDEVGSTTEVEKIDMDICFKHRGATLNHDLYFKIPGLESVGSYTIKRQLFSNDTLDPATTTVVLENSSNLISIFKNDKSVMPPNATVGRNTYSNTRGNWESETVTPARTRIIIEFNQGTKLQKSNMQGLEPPSIVQINVLRGNSTNTDYVIRSNELYPTLNGSTPKNNGVDNAKKIYIIDGWKDYKIPKEKKPIYTCYPFFIKYLKDEVLNRNWFLTRREQFVYEHASTPSVTWDATTFDS